MKKMLPFVPFKIHVARRLARPFLRVSDIITRFSPNLGVVLNQAEFEIETREYISIAVFTAVFWFFMVFSMIFVLAQVVTGTSYIAINLVSSSLISMLFLVYMIMYPKLVVVRKLKDLDRNLLYGLRDLNVQIKSGVPLFDAMVSISKKDYGRLSEEFKDCVKHISTGASTTDSLEELALKNPSLNFRRSIWQMVNAIRSGTNLGKTLDSVVNTISNEQRIQIKKYGSQLNPLAMMYMMVGVIFPSLGITFLVIISSFSGFPVTETLFWSIMIVLIVFQFAFIGIVKSRRPSIEI
jgi:flagellar protein FlaJ